MFLLYMSISSLQITADTHLGQLLILSVTHLLTGNKVGLKYGFNLINVRVAVFGFSYKVHDACVSVLLTLVFKEINLKRPKHVGSRVHECFG